MEKSGSPSRFEESSLKWLREQLDLIGQQEFPYNLNPQTVYHLTALPLSARAFILAALQNKIKGSKLVLTGSVKAQEELANDLEAWETPYLFFPQIEQSSEATLPDQEIVAERMAVLTQLISFPESLVLTTTAASEQPLPSPRQVQENRMSLSSEEKINREEWIQRLAENGYQREAQVQERGTFSVRGAIIDFFPWDALRPLRTEWMGDEIVSLREFDPAQQRSLKELSVTSFALSNLSLVPKENDTLSSLNQLSNYLSSQTLIFNLDEKIARERHELPDSEEENRIHQNLEFFEHDFLHAPRGDFIMQEHRREIFLQHLQDWLSEEWRIAIFCNNEGEQKRLSELIEEAGLPLDSIQFIIRPLLRGFVWPKGRLVVLTDAEIFGRYQTLRAVRKQEKLSAIRAHQNPLDFSEITEGDYVVHLYHGIAFYRGLQLLPDEKGNQTEVLLLEFAEQAKLYVPVEQAFLVSKYVGVGRKTPKLDALGGGHWEKAKSSARKAAMDYAAKLLSIQAERNALPGHAFSADSPWQKEFEEAFIYEETEDQLQAIQDTKRDMESTLPMDRLICGDVGFGKTEVAIRAALKAVLDGKQVAFLVPTTVLAQQHYKTLCERFADYPIKIDILSRFRTISEQKKVIKQVSEGGVDIVVGTHRLISKDVSFKDLGLVIVDEEQRFGVIQKEKFKDRFRLVDVISLSATPIPRTLYLSLTGARDLSVIETPPQNRHPVETIISPYDERIIREAIRRELARNGQVYFLHNRIGTIHEIAEKVRSLVPEAKVDIGHGQMDESELEETMTRFVAGEIDVLISTTIIESGLDIPNANTILIDRADRFGLADLYQLRGRVGRAQHRAYAYLFLPRHLMTVADARKRVNAIRQYSQLGAGFKIAMRDLEIRGAGSLLGTAQSGHITAVGFDLYCQLLKLAVSQMKGGKIAKPIDCKLMLDFLVWHEIENENSSGAYIPRKYISESRWRIEAYRRLAGLISLEELSHLRDEWRDRYGPFPLPIELLILASEIKLRASSQHIVMIETEGEKLILKQGNKTEDFIMIGGKFPRLTSLDAHSKLNEINQWIISLAQAN